MYIPSRRSQPRRLSFTETNPFYRGIDFFPQNVDVCMDDMIAEQERRECYENELRLQAYLEALERKRREKLLEEERRKEQYRMEIEQRLHEEQEQRELQHQIMTYLKCRDQEKVREEIMRRQRAKAIEELRNQDVMRKACSMKNMNHQDEELIQGLDGNLYRVIQHNHPINLRRSKPMAKKEKMDDGLGSDLQSRKLFINLSKKDELGGSTKAPKNELNKKRAKIFKSSILIGEVEDASDSECEQEFNDCWHNRRPSPGEWIEPVTNMTA